MATNSHSLSKIHPSISPIHPQFTKPNTSSNSPLLSISSISSHNSILSTLTLSLLQPSSKITHLPSISSNKRHVSAAVSLSLPTANPDRVTGDKVPKWSRRAIKSYAMGILEARKLKYPATGTEALLMGILIEATNLASKFLRENGITLTKVKEESVKLNRKGDFFFFSQEHLPLTESAQKALDWAVDHRLKSGENGEITTADLLLGIWSETESPGHKVLAALGFDNEKAEKLKALGSKLGITED